MPESLSIATDSRMESEQSRHKVWLMFDRIANRYDLLNRLLSLRQDVAWRKRLTCYLPPGDQLRLLDVATGTADVPLIMMQNSDRIISAAGVDMAENMLAIGRKKIAQKGLSQRIVLHKGDATGLNLNPKEYDVVTIAFGIRNVEDVDAALQSMREMLKPGGRLLVLEFSLPASKMLRKAYLFYFRKILPHIGALISGDSQAYHYLNKTVESFPYGQAFCTIMENNGYAQVKAHALSFGIASIYHGDRPLTDTTE